jgi:ornithine carbamoyltransferase
MYLKQPGRPGPTLCLRADSRLTPAPDMCPALDRLLSGPGSADAAAALAQRAVRLHATRGEWTAPPLQGRHVAIAALVHDTPSARRFEQAAVQLGARVSHIGADALALDLSDPERTAHILGSLYDAIDFIALEPDRVHLLERAAGVPAFADLGGENSPLLALLPSSASPEQREAALLALVQAVLVETMR